MDAKDFKVEERKKYTVMGQTYFSCPYEDPFRGRVCGENGCGHHPKDTEASCQQIKVFTTNNAILFGIVRSWYQFWYDRVFTSIKSVS